MLSLLDHHPRGPVGEDPAAGPMDVPVSAQLAGLTVVDHEDVDPESSCSSARLLALDPVVHRVADDQLRTLHLLEDAQLEIGIDVAQEEKARGAEGWGKTRTKVREHTETGLQRFPALEIIGVFALPPKALPVCLFDARPVDSAGSQPLELVIRIILADHSDHLDRVENRSRDTEIHRGPAERVRGLAKGRKDRVQCDAAHHQKVMRSHPVRGRDSEQLQAVRENDAGGPGEEEPGLLDLGRIRLPCGSGDTSRELRSRARGDTR